MEDQKLDVLYDFIHTNKMYYCYLLISHISLFLVTFLCWILTINIYTGDKIYWVFCMGYFIIYLPIIPFSIHIFKQSKSLFQIFGIKDIKRFGKQKLISNLIISTFAIIILLKNILIPFTDFYSWEVLGTLEYYFGDHFIPLSADINGFLLRFLSVFLSLNVSFFMDLLPILWYISVPGLLLIFIIALMMNVACYMHLRRLLLIYVRHEIDYVKILGIFKKLLMYLILFFISIIFTITSMILEYRRPGYLFSDLFGTILFYIFINYTYISILRNMEQIPLNSYLNTFSSQRLYKLEKDVKLNEHAIVFEPVYISYNVKESKGLMPSIGVLMMILGGIFTFVFGLFIWQLLSQWDYYLNEPYSPNWLLFWFINFTISTSTFLIGLFSPPNYYKMERTANEIHFQKGFRTDHISLNQLQEIAVDYDVIDETKRVSHNLNEYESTLKLKITIALLIPDHTVCITKDIKMVYHRGGNESLESQLARVLTKTLFILGYIPNQ